MAKMGRPPKPAIDRFFAMVQAVDSGCFEWTGRIDRYGYGQFLAAGGRNGKKVGAHRWAYENLAGPIPDGYQIDHLCRNRRCVNPEHLEAVTPRENVLRGFNPTSINARKTHCLRGHPFSPENTFIRDGKRGCITCRRTRDLAYYHARKAAS